MNKGGKTPSGNANEVSSTSTASVTAEIVTVGAGTSRCTDPLLRIAQLEQNIRFLQEQHAQMLAGLHQEIDTLRQRNRGIYHPCDVCNMCTLTLNWLRIIFNFF